MKTFTKSSIDGSELCEFVERADWIIRLSGKEMLSWSDSQRGEGSG